MGTKKGGKNMKCQKIKRMLPLLAGDELPESQIAKVKGHLRGCLRCQEEYEKYVFLVHQTRKWLGEDRVGWDEQEWRRTVQTVLEQEAEKKNALAPWPFSRAWAYTLMAGVLLLLTTLVFRPPLVKHFGLTPESMDAARMEEKLGDGRGEQEIVSMTMVSEETGLKIVWFLNKNFNLEENE
jgi:hypothetical protein